MVSAQLKIGAEVAEAFSAAAHYLLPRRPGHV